MKKRILTLTAALAVLTFSAACFAACSAPSGAAAPAVTAVTAAPAPAETAAPAAETAPATAAPAAETPAPTAAPAASDGPSPSVVAKTAIGGRAGTFTFDEGGTVWTLTLRENGTYTLQEARADKTTALHTGESWLVNADGSVTCGPTDIWKASFSVNDGGSEWVLYSDGTCSPIIPAA